MPFSLISWASSSNSALKYLSQAALVKKRLENCSLNYKIKAIHLRARDKWCLHFMCIPTSGSSWRSNLMIPSNLLWSLCLFRKLEYNKCCYKNFDIQSWNFHLQYWMKTRMLVEMLFSFEIYYMILNFYMYHHETMI
jgi:hypothetical protein